jgi:GST-like protein
MIRFYYNLSPNPMKVALFLEEAELAYEAVPVDTRKGQQFSAEYLAINPNGKVPAIADGETIVFDSNAILLYLAEKTGKFLPAASRRGEFLSWLMFVATGVGPFSGQAVHFRHFAGEPVPYALNRYMFEVRRHYKILDARLGDQAYIVGDRYSVVDMAAWGWTRMVPFVLGDDGWNAYPNLKRHHDAIAARPAAARLEALRTRHAFKAEMDEEARRNMFGHLNERAA